MRTTKAVTKGTTTDNYKYIYENGLLMQMRCNNIILDFTYGANNGNLMRLTYGNGNRVDYTYDRFGNFATVARFINGAYQLEKYDTFYYTLLKTFETM